MLTFVSIVSYAAAVAFVGAIGCAAARRWGLAAALSSSATLASVCVLSLLLGRLVASYRSADPWARVTALTVSLSELMNCGMLPLLIAVAGAIVWVQARKRLRPPT